MAAKKTGSAGAGKGKGGAGAINRTSKQQAASGKGTKAPPKPPKLKNGK